MTQSIVLSRIYAPVLAVALVIMGFSAAPTFAQDQDQEIATEGQEHREMFNEALEIAREGQAAAEAEDFETAYARFNEAREMLLEAGELAVANDEAQVQDQAVEFAAQFAYRAGMFADRLERHEDALSQFETGIEINPNFAPNYLGRAVAYRKMEQHDEAIEAYADAMEAGDANVRAQAENAIRSHFHHRASQLLGQESVTRSAAQEAVGYLEEMEGYVDPNASTYFYRAVAHEAMGNLTEAIEFATQAINMHTGSRGDRARIHLIRGEAHLSAGNTSEACQDFQEANVGDVQQRAQHHLEHSCS